MTNIELALDWLIDNADSLDIDDEESFPDNLVEWPDEIDLTDHEVEVIKDHWKDLFYDGENFRSYVLMNLWH
jgi:hypothetical protein